MKEIFVLSFEIKYFLVMFKFIFIDFKCLNFKFKVPN